MRSARTLARRSAGATFLLLSVLYAQSAQDWTHFVRIAGHGLRSDNADQIVRSATASGVFGIEVDNDIPGRYESFVDPAEKLRAIHAVAEKAHAAGNYAFVYIAGTECITAHAAQAAHSMFKDHPDWIQRNIKGEPAIFGGGEEFWIREGDEDVWISPFAKEWRKIYMERVRQIAATGIDGIYVDIPYWMTHFRKWEDTWASFDDATVAAFKAKTGLNAKTDLKLGDFRDANFRKWVDFRIDAITDFMRDIDTNAKSVNPKCKTIAEIYPGIEESAVRVGSDVYELYPVVDTIAHEYETGGMSASRTPLSWFQDMIGMYSFRAFAEGKPSWMLSYSWEKEKKIAPAEAMKNLAMAQLMAGTNTWDAQGHVMSGSNDIQARKLIFEWIKEHEKTFFLPRQPISPIGVYFSPKTRDYFADEFIQSYRGIMLLLLQSHLEFQIVTPRTVANFHGDLLIVPDERAASDPEVKSFRAVIGTIDTGKTYYAALEKEFNQAAGAGKWEGTDFDNLRQKDVRKLLATSRYKPAVEIDAPPFVATQIAAVDGKPTVFFANFGGLKSKETADQIPARNVKISFATSGAHKVAVLPFLGQVQEVEGTLRDGKLTVEIPLIQKGAVVWLE